MNSSRRNKWTSEKIVARLLPVADELKRMPSARELRIRGHNDLACAVGRCGGFRWWAGRLGLMLKDSETMRGLRWEDAEERYFKSVGFDVERQTVKAPFDLLVNKNRVDVKSAKWTVCQHTRGFVFAGLKRGVDCDFFDLVCVNENKLIERFVVPSSEAKIHTLTITKKTIDGNGLYSRFHNAVDALES